MENYEVENINSSIFRIENKTLLSDDMYHAVGVLVAQASWGEYICIQMITGISGIKEKNIGEIIFSSSPISSTIKTIRMLVVEKNKNDYEEITKICDRIEKCFEFRNKVARSMLFGENVFFDINNIPHKHAIARSKRIKQKKNTVIIDSTEKITTHKILRYALLMNKSCQALWGFCRKKKYDNWGSRISISK